MSEPVVVSAADYAARLRVLMRRSSEGWPRRAKDRWILLRAIADAFSAEERLDERTFTGRIQDFLLAHGGHLGLDAVTLRRMLVDEGFAERDAWGREYRASRRHERRVRFEGERPAPAALGS